MAGPFGTASRSKAGRIGRRVELLQQISPVWKDFGSIRTCRQCVLTGEGQVVMARVPNGASEAFELLYAAQYESIYAYARRRMDSASDVSDAVSEVFTVAWRRIDELPPPPQDRLWLFGVAHRCVLAHQRRRWNQLRLLSTLAAQPNRIELIETGNDYLRNGIRSAIQKLRDKDREVIILLYWDGLTHAEAASVLGCSVNAVALRVKKAKARLHSELSPTITEEDSTSLPPLLTPRKEFLP